MSTIHSSHTALAAAGKRPGVQSQVRTLGPAAHPHQHALAPRAAIDVSSLIKDDEARAVADATALLRNGLAKEALVALKNLKGPASALIRARAALLLRDVAMAKQALLAVTDAALAPQVLFARGQLAQLQEQHAQAAAFFLPLTHKSSALAARAVLPLAQALCVADPKQFVDMLPRLLKLCSTPNNGGSLSPSHMRSAVLALAAQAHERLGDPAEATALLLRRYLEEPNAQDAAMMPPPLAVVSEAQEMQRIEKLLEAHSSSAALAAIAAFDALYAPALLSQDLHCRRHFALGLAQRKLHRYAAAEQNMAHVKSQCGHDEELARRAAFIEAKVVSIQDGLRALPLIEAFAGQHPNNSMVDDVLFWAGDSLQRRGRIDEAEHYFERILQLPTPDDQCEEAAWRLAWLAYVDHKPQLARRRLLMALASRCPKSADGLARAHYWLGRIDEQAQLRQRAVQSYRRAKAAKPWGFYGQMATASMLPLLPSPTRLGVQSDAARLRQSQPLGLCPAHLADEPALRYGLKLLRLGLTQDALAQFATVPWPSPIADKNGRVDLQRCGRAQAGLLLVQLRFAAGDHAGGLALLLQHFSQSLLVPPDPSLMNVVRAAYPLAYRPLIQAAEVEQNLPRFLLQALAREESRFDSHVVSWAEAYGLTQLTLAAAQTAGRSIKLKPLPKDKTALFDAAQNARLGGALLGHLGRRYHGFWPLALAAYNGGQKNADLWWQRFGGEDVARMLEELPVRETRTYVQRVLESYAIYDLLYGGGAKSYTLPKKVPRPQR